MVGTGGDVMVAREPGRQGRRNRRDLILDAAQTLFARDGYGQTGIRAIAAAVGISEATIYHYFRSKSEILDGIISRASAGQLRAYPFPPDTSLEEVLRTVGRMYLQTMAVPANRDLIHLLLTEAAHDPAHAERYLADVWDQAIAALEDAITERLPATSPASANTLARMFAGALTQHIIHSEGLAAVAGRPLVDGVDPDRWLFLDEVIGVVIRGVVPEPEG